MGREDLAAAGERTLDSGVLLHCVGEDGGAGGVWIIDRVPDDRRGHRRLHPRRRQEPADHTCETVAGRQTDLLQSQGRDAEVHGGPDQLVGRDPAWKDVKGFRGKNDVEKPVGEWNRLECICDGDKITNVLNGTVVNVGTKSSPQRARSCSSRKRGGLLPQDRAAAAQEVSWSAAGFCDSGKNVRSVGPPGYRSGNGSPTSLRICSLLTPHGFLTLCNTGWTGLAPGARIVAGLLSAGFPPAWFLFAESGSLYWEWALLGAGLVLVLFGLALCWFRSELVLRLGLRLLGRSLGGLAGTPAPHVLRAAACALLVCQSLHGLDCLWLLAALLLRSGCVSAPG